MAEISASKTPPLYERYYKRPHTAPETLQSAVFGLPEWFAGEIRTAAFVSNPGCYPTGAILPLAPLVKEGIVDPNTFLSVRFPVFPVQEEAHLQICRLLKSTNRSAHTKSALTSIFRRSEASWKKFPGQKTHADLRAAPDSDHARHLYEHLFDIDRERLRAGHRSCIRKILQVRSFCPLLFIGHSGNKKCCTNELHRYRISKYFRKINNLSFSRSSTTL